MALKRPRFALFCDDAGGPADEWRSLAVVGGPLVNLLELEHSLRRVLKQCGLPELKWSQVRKRPAGLRAAALMLERATAAAQAKQVRFQLWLWQAPKQPRAWHGLIEHQRMQRVYAALLPRTARAWKEGRWSLLPDERTGVEWRQLQRSLAAPFKQAGARLDGLYQVDSRRWALVQLCDLLAGLTRHSIHPEAVDDAPGSDARRNRHSLLRDLLAYSRDRRLGLAHRTWLQGRGSAFTATLVKRWS
jgi:hypothetical protein